MSVVHRAQYLNIMRFSLFQCANEEVSDHFSGMFVTIS
jgi:hypothetical protein